MILGSTGKSIRISENLSISASDITGETVEVAITSNQTEAPALLTVNSDKLRLNVINTLYQSQVFGAYGSLASEDIDTEELSTPSLNVSGHKIGLTENDLHRLTKILEDVCRIRDEIRDTIGETFVQTLLKNFKQGAYIRFHTSTDKNTLHTGIPVACDGAFLTMSLPAYEQRSYRLSTITSFDILTPNHQSRRI